MEVKVHMYIRGFLSLLGRFRGSRASQWLTTHTRTHTGSILATMLGGQSGKDAKKAQIKDGHHMFTVFWPGETGKMEKWSVLVRFPLWVSVVRTWLEPSER